MFYIDIWRVGLDGVLQEGQYEEFYSILDDEERERCDGFVNYDLAKRFLISHFYLRKILSYYCNDISSQDWKFIYNSYGRPEISLDHGLSLTFNMTHNKHDAYYIVTPGYICGIDVEEITDIDMDKSLMDMIFSDDEQKRLNELPLSLKKYAFFHYWTLKEAHFKALGVGFSGGLEGVEFVLKEEDIKSQRVIGLKKKGGRFYWTKYLADRKQILSVALFV